MDKPDAPDDVDVPADVEDVEDVDVGPYGPRGKDTPPLTSMMGGYGIIFGAVVILPFLLFALIRFVIL